MTAKIRSATIRTMSQVVLIGTFLSMKDRADLEADGRDPGKDRKYAELFRLGLAFVTGDERSGLPGRGCSFPAFHTGQLFFRPFVWHFITSYLNNAYCIPNDHYRELIFEKHSRCIQKSPAILGGGADCCDFPESSVKSGHGSEPESQVRESVCQVFPRRGIARHFLLCRRAAAGDGGCAAKQGLALLRGRPGPGEERGFAVRGRTGAGLRQAPFAGFQIPQRPNFGSTFSRTASLGRWRGSATKRRPRSSSKIMAEWPDWQAPARYLVLKRWDKMVERFALSA